MHLRFALYVNFGLVACVANAQNSITPPLNDASLIVTGTVQGAVFRLGAWGLGGPRVAHVASAFPLPRVLGGFSVRIGAAQAMMLSVMPSNESPIAPADYWVIRGILPSDAPAGGSGPVSLTYNGQILAVSRFSLSVARRGIGLYHAGPFQATASNVDAEGNWTTNTYGNPARPGQSVVLWGTGLGAVIGDEAAGPLPQAVDITGLRLLVGNKPARIVYAGRSGCCAGVDQIVFETPIGMEGCHVPVAVRYRDGEIDRDSNYVYVSIASGGGECSDPHGWPASVLEKMRMEGSVNIGQILPGLAIFSKVYGFAIPPFGTCSRVEALGALIGPGRLAYEGAGGTAVGPVTSLSEPLGPVVKSFHPFDAGPAVNFKTPQGFLSIAKRGPGVYHTGYSPVYPEPVAPAGPGEYRIDNGAGGVDIGPFQAVFNDVPPSDFTYHYEKSSDGTLVTWSGGGQKGGYVVIRERYVISGDTGFSFVCVEQANKGSFLIPPEFLSGCTGLFCSYGLDVRYEIPYRFSAPGLDLAEFVYSFQGR